MDIGNDAYCVRQIKCSDLQFYSGMIFRYWNWEWNNDLSYSAVMTFYQIMSKEYANYEGLVHCSVQVRLVSDRENGTKRQKRNNIQLLNQTKTLFEVANHISFVFSNLSKKIKDMLDFHLRASCCDSSLLPGSSLSFPLERGLQLVSYFMVWLIIC